MATRTRLSLTRDQLASFLQDHEQIKQFERLFATVDSNTNDIIPGVEFAAGNSGQAANDALAEIAALAEALNKEPSPASASQLAVIESQIEDLALTPPPLDSLAILASIPTSVVVTKTADFTVAPNETWIINNKSGSTCTVTLPSAATYPGRYLTFQNNQDQTLVSASSDVIPQGGGSAGTAILTNVSGNWATLVSNGTNWVIMQAASFNNLLY
jgi:hypothetical protein